MSRVKKSCSVGGLSLTQGTEYDGSFEEWPDEKLRVVLSVLRGELSVAATGRRAGVSEQTVHNWKKAFLEGGRDRLVLGARRRSARETELEAEREELKAALGDTRHQGTPFTARHPGRFRRFRLLVRDMTRLPQATLDVSVLARGSRRSV